VILVDANILIYGIDADAPAHARAHRWLEDALSGHEPVGLAWVVLLAFLRLVTREGILRRPLDLESALAYVDEWVELPVVRVVAPGPAHWGVLRGLLANAGAAGNLTSDAHLAALALEHNASICSADHDFLRFPGIRLINPLAP
jgi:toxin-antitoxin system PIN domain toxin